MQKRSRLRQRNRFWRNCVWQFNEKTAKNRKLKFYSNNAAKANKTMKTKCKMKCKMKMKTLETKTLRMRLEKSNSKTKSKSKNPTETTNSSLTMTSSSKKRKWRKCKCWRNRKVRETQMPTTQKMRTHKFEGTDRQGGQHLRTMRMLFSVAEDANHPKTDQWRHSTTTFGRQISRK